MQLLHLDAARFLIAASVVVNLYAGDWPAFRGPNSSGVANEKALPVEMGATQNLVWKTALPPGHSSPVLMGDSIFVTAWEPEKLFVISLNRQSGAIRWRREIPRARKQELHKSNSPASPSVATDGKNVYAFFTDFGLVAYGWDGQERWKMPLGPFNNPFGMGASPLLVDDRVILNCDSETDAFIVAVDKNSGKTLWRVERPDVGRGFSTPVLYQPPQGAKQALVAGSNQLTAYDVLTGKVVWYFRGLTWQLKPTPVVDGSTVYVLGWAGGSDLGQQEEIPPFEEVLSRWDKNHDRKLSPDEIPDAKMVADLREGDLDRDGAYGERDWRMFQAKRKSLNAITAIKLGGSGDVTDTNLVWRYTKSLPNATSPLLYNGFVWMIKDGGVLTTLDAATGAVVKQARVAGALDPYYASPVASDGKVFTVSEACNLAVLQASGQWELLKVNSFDDVCHASPALADGRVYLRTKSALYAFSQSPSSSK